MVRRDQFGQTDVWPKILCAFQNEETRCSKADGCWHAWFRSVVRYCVQQRRLIMRDGVKGLPLPRALFVGRVECVEDFFIHARKRTKAK